MRDFHQKNKRKYSHSQGNSGKEKPIKESLMKNILSPYTTTFHWLNSFTNNFQKRDVNSSILDSYLLQPFLALIDNLIPRKIDWKVKDQAKPFFYKGNEIGIILTHGFSSTPQEMRGLGEYLHKEFGYSTFGVLLAGHGTSPADLAQTEMIDWYKSLRIVYHSAREICKKIILIGHSMGGTLSLILAANESVDGIVSLCTPVKVEYFMQDYLNFISGLIRYFPRRKEEREIMDKYHLVNYRRTSLKAVEHLLDLMVVAKEEMPKVTAPIFTITAGKDKRVPLYNADMIRQLVKSEVKEDYFAKDAHHTILFSDVKEIVFEKIQTFIKSII